LSSERHARAMSSSDTDPDAPAASMAASQADARATSGAAAWGVVGCVAVLELEQERDDGTVR
jgi:hypothetical protein